MSLTADTADAIIAVDEALERFERTPIMQDGLQYHVTWTALKDAIENLQETALGEGMHFDSLEEARNFRTTKTGDK